MKKFLNTLLIIVGGFLVIVGIYIALREFGITSGKEYGIGLAVVYAAVGGVLLAVGVVKRKEL